MRVDRRAARRGSRRERAKCTHAWTDASGGCHGLHDSNRRRSQSGHALAARTARAARHRAVVGHLARGVDVRCYAVRPGRPVPCTPVLRLSIWAACGSMHAAALGASITPRRRSACHVRECARPLASFGACGADDSRPVPAKAAVPNDMRPASRPPERCVHCAKREYHVDANREQRA